MKKMTLKVALLAALVATAGVSVAADMASVEAEIKAASFIPTPRRRKRRSSR